MMELVLAFFDKSNEAMKKGASVEKLISMDVRESIGRFKYVKTEDTEKQYSEILHALDKEIDEIVKGGED